MRAIIRTVVEVAAPLLLLLAAAQSPAAEANTAVATKDLARGKSLRITMIHEPGFINMKGEDGLVKPTSQWSGFLVDLLRRVSTEAGFTYTLHSPSGNGGALCAPTNLTGPARQAFYATQYNCGQADTETQETDVYWGMYYMTNGRIARGTLFTIPYLSDAGLSMLTVAEAEPSWTSEATKIFKPCE
jgi:hypothetical protein